MPGRRKPQKAKKSATLAPGTTRALTPQVVAVDTNVLYSRDESQNVSAQFDKAWDKNSGITSLQLVIPEIVREEILFQQTSLALSSFEKAKNEAGTLSKITGVAYPIDWREDVVRGDVKKKFDLWSAGKPAIIAPLIHAEVNYPEITRKALWREPPFTKDPKAKEKGLRDALVHRR